MAKCFWCEGTGKYKKPNKEEKYNQLFDMYDAPGVLTMRECRERALKEVGYELIRCPYCHGTGKEEATLIEQILSAKMCETSDLAGSTSSEDESIVRKDRDYPHSIKQDGEIDK